MRHDLLAALAIIPLLAGCGGSGGGKVQSTRPPLAKPVKPAKGPVRQPIKAAPRPAEVHMVPGLEGVIGATASELTRRFGPARLDVWEGDARKLQFSGLPCVLDVYLYPSAAGREPQATYADARRASDGKDVDKAACASSLKRP
jgi:hypothetical protein